MKYLLGIDLGTSGTKTVLFDQNGKGICSATIEYPMYQPQNGWAEQDPKDWYNAAVNTIRTVLTNSVANRVSLLGTQNDVLGASLLWNMDGTPAEIIEAGMPAWQALCDTFNAAGQ